MGPARCIRLNRRGWYCSREFGHDGVCALRPRWWNLFDRLRYGSGVS